MTRIHQFLERMYAMSRSAWLAVSSDPGMRILAIAVLAFGALLRINRYIYNRSLFLDEAYIASNILNRDLAELTLPLDYFQVAPAGWLWLVKLATLAFGISEPALRLMPLLAGLTSLVLFYLLSKRFLSPRGMMIGCLFIAMIDSPIHWSVMVKPYSTDMLFTLAILLLAVRVNWGDPSRRSIFALAGLGAVAIWFSFPSVFVLVAVGAYALVRTGFGGGIGKLTRISTIGIIWIISFTAHFCLKT